jgi:redox-regulated HSP33 family molecular chaperone
VRSLGKEQIARMLDEQEEEGKERELEVTCRFCSERYVFGEAELLAED